MRLLPLVVIFTVIFPLSVFSSNTQVITIEGKDGKGAVVFYKFRAEKAPRGINAGKLQPPQNFPSSALSEKRRRYDPNALDTRGMDIKNTVKYIPIRKRTKRTSNSKSTKGHEIKASRGIILRVAPNPFSKEVLISYSLPRSAYVSICVYDLGGRKVRTLLEGRQIKGIHRLSWNGRDNHGRMLPSGYYFCEARVSGKTITRKILKLY
ncbi:MAG: T9SS type A sorting domain-containing protein [Candidatus Hydrothermae bacterium]|nr:T9SS type A sorting domain-containing protein [Candidatus Hydrothermae bacterium]